MTDDLTPPRLFISYSWSSAEHETWVLELATRLTEQGVQVVLDKWDLREGNDAYKFMEQMVTDPTVTKVIMVSDQVYARKADGRAGGVGTETQIISREVYEREDQGKFVAIVPEKSPDGKAPLPTYYKSRVYIDFSDASKYVESFDQLLRWIYDKPLYVRPALGKSPAFLADNKRVHLGTEALFTRCMDAIKTAKPFASGSTDEFLTEFAANLERFRVEPKDDTHLDDLIVESIEEFTPYRSQVIQLVTAVAQYAPTMEYATKLHRFFERLLPYMERPENLMQWNECQFDNLKFVVHELFLYATVVLIDNERFDLANHLLVTPYYMAGRSEAGYNAIVDFRHFRQHGRSFQVRNQRLGSRRLSLRSDMLKERAASSGVPFNSLMQADFVLFMRAQRAYNDRLRWWPETLLYASYIYGPFEKFSRSSSRSYFDRFKIVLDVETPDDVRELCALLAADQNRVPRWEVDSFNPASLAAAKELGTLP